MQIFKWISTVSLLLSFLSCKYVDTKKIPLNQIIEASEWSIEDQHPLFEKCEKLLEISQQKSCFEENLLNLIYEGLLEAEIESSEPFDSKIIIILKIDQNGLFSIDKFEDLEGVLKKVFNLKTQIKKIVNNLPKALPAIKTNVGTYVNVKFILPIKIKASISE